MTTLPERWPRSSTLIWSSVARVSRGGVCLVGDEAIHVTGEEIHIDTAHFHVVRRGILGTVAVDHPAGTPVYNPNGVDADHDDERAAFLDALWRAHPTLLNFS